MHNFCWACRSRIRTGICGSIFGHQLPVCACLAHSDICQQLQAHLPASVLGRLSNMLNQTSCHVLTA